MEKLDKPYDLSNKVAILTDASKELNAAIALGLAECGANVIISSRQQEAVDTVVKNLKNKGYEATGIACDLGDAAQCKKLIQQSVAIYGGIDILINNAATNPVVGPMVERDVQLFDETMDINVKASFLLANLCHPIMKKRGNGSIINISSVEGVNPALGTALYNISKSALITLTENQAEEWGKDNIQSNVICIEFKQTNLSADFLWIGEMTPKNTKQHLYSGEIEELNEIVDFTLFLASSNSFSTGGVYNMVGWNVISG